MILKLYIFLIYNFPNLGRDTFLIYVKYLFRF